MFRRPKKWAAIQTLSELIISLFHLIISFIHCNTAQTVETRKNKKRKTIFTTSNNNLLTKKIGALTVYIKGLTRGEEKKQVPLKCPTTG